MQHTRGTITCAHENKNHKKNNKLFICVVMQACIPKYLQIEIRLKFSRVF